MKKIRVLFVHNYYQFRGGEDEMADLDTKLLEKNGHDVFFFWKHNKEINNYSPTEKISLVLKPTFSLQIYFKILKIISEFRPDVIHINNFFPLISPSVIYAGLRKKVPVVMSLHDFRLICANGLLLRNSKICEKCFDSPIFSLIYGCYRNSRTQTFPVYLMISLHKVLDTWSKGISAFITPSDFVRRKFIDAGFAANKIFVRPNYVEDDFVRRFENRGFQKGNYFVFVGRLSEEKGIKILLSAWDILKKENLRFKLKIAGDGPLMGYVRAKARENDLVEVLGFVKKENLVGVIAEAKAMIVPSIWYEVFGRTVIESYALGTPVLASKIGALKDIVIDGVTGALFEPTPQNIIGKIKNTTPEEIKSWGQNARKEYLNKYTEEIAYNNLIAIYESVVNT